MSYNSCEVCAEVLMDTKSTSLKYFPHRFFHFSLAQALQLKALLVAVVNNLKLLPYFQPGAGTDRQGCEYIWEFFCVGFYGVLYNKFRHFSSE